MERGAGADALFMYATEGILVVNDKGKIIRANPSVERLFGYRQGELIGKTVEELVPRRLVAQHTKHRTGYNRDPHARSMGANLELYGRRKDNTEFPVEISLSPYSIPEGRFVIAFIIDISLRKQSEEKMKNYQAELETQVKKRTLVLEEAIEELQKTKAELHAALEKERELNELKSRFVSMASHEFRTPLATVLSSVSLVSKYAEQGDREKQSRHIVKIKAAIKDLTDILNDFLSVSKLEEGKVEAALEKLDLKEFIAGVIHEMEPLARDSQRLVHQHQGKKSAKLDPMLLKNVLFNLISNAIKFSDDGQDIQVQSACADGTASILVKDKGMGVPKEDQKHLFERFFRGRNATHIQGTGLGLNIVMRYVELMNGTIVFKSVENKGTTFTLTFKQ